MSMTESHEGIPKHVAYIVDGNGRWAVKQGKDRTWGHIMGANRTVDIIKSSFDLGVDTITLYLFSTENWSRPADEVFNIMRLLEKYLKEFSNYLVENRVVLRVIGQKHRLNENIRNLIDKVGYQPSKPNRNGDKLSNPSDRTRTLCLAISYGGRDDIVEACQRMLSSQSPDVVVTESLFHQFTSTGQLNISDPDLIIRTSGSFRLSNFLLWQSAYAEFSLVQDYCKCSLLLSNPSHHVTIV